MSPDQRSPTLRADIYTRSSESMRELEDDSVTLTLTSPPYWSLVDFERADRGQHRQACWQNTYTRDYATYRSYLAAMQRTFAEVLRVTKPGGHLALQVASMQRSGRVYPIPMDLTKRLVDLGFAYREHIFWHKTRNTDHRAGVTIQNPYPGYYYPGLVGEHLLIFRKPGPRLFEGVDERIKVRAKFPISTLFTVDVLKAVWHIPINPPGSVNHPTVFPEELCHRVIALWSYPGDLVLDPFCGSGQTTKVAHAMGRACVGYEIEPGFAALARRRMHEPLKLRRRQIVPRYDHVEDDPFLNVGTDVPQDESTETARTSPDTRAHDTEGAREPESPARTSHRGDSD